MISIIVPVYKINESYFHECIQSLCNQTLKEIEIILVDDGSPDNCGKLCDDYAAKDSRVKVIHQENQGVSVARNQGIDAATAEWIMFVDGDDWLELDACEIVLEGAIQYNSPDILLFSGWRNSATREEAYVPRNQDIFHCKTKEETRRIINYTLSPRLGINSIHGTIFTSSAVWCRLFRKDFLMRFSLRFIPGISIGEDILFMLYAMNNAQFIAYYDVYLYHYRIHDESTVHRYNKNGSQIFREFLIHLEAFVSSISENKKYDVWSAYASRVFFVVRLCMGICFDHPDNPNPLSTRLRSCHQAMNDPIFREGIQMARFTGLPFKMRMQLLLFKLRLFFLASFLSRINRVLTHKS